jgi:hypothetical protein
LRGNTENGNIKSYRERSYGGYLVELKETSEPIGMCGLFKRMCLIILTLALLLRILREGLWFEAASAVLNMSENCKSQRFLELRSRQ